MESRKRTSNGYTRTIKDTQPVSRDINNGHRQNAGEEKVNMVIGVDPASDKSTCITVHEKYIRREDKLYRSYSFDKGNTWTKEDEIGHVMTKDKRGEFKPNSPSPAPQE